MKNLQRLAIALTNDLLAYKSLSMLKNMDNEEFDTDGFLEILDCPLDVKPLYAAGAKIPTMLKILITAGGPTVSLDIEDNGFFTFFHSEEGHLRSRLGSDAREGLDLYLEQYNI